MSKLHDIYQRLRSVPDPSVDLAMAAALPTADPLAVQLLGTSLLERQNPDGMLSLVLHFHHLPEKVQEAVVQQVSLFYHALRVATDLREGIGPTNVIEIIRRAKAVRLAYLLVDLLRLGSGQVREQAAGCLRDLVQNLPAEDGSPVAPLDPVATAAMLSALQEALTLYRHHGQADVLMAMNRLALRATSSILRVLQDKSHPAVVPLRRVLESSRNPESLRTLLMWARVSPLTDAALGTLQTLSPAGLGAVLESAHLLPIGATQRALRRLANPQFLCPRREQLDDFQPGTRRALPRWIMALPLEPGQQVNALAQLTHAPDRQTRLAALWQLIALAERGDAPAANGAISGFCADSDPAVARIALRHLVRRRWSGLAKLLLTLVNSPHEEIRHLAGGHLAPLGFAKFWDAWPRLTYAQQLAGGQALIKIDPHFHRLLGEKLARPERAGRLRAMAMIYGLNQGAFFEQPLIALTRDHDEVVASAAVRALGSGQSPAVIEALELTLRHPDSRVRANAIESLQQMRSIRHVGRLLEMAQQDDNRPRANAIHALMELRTDEAMAALANMLADERPTQRASALWLVDQLGLVEVARHVAEMSITDPDPAIKSRASNVIHRLIESLHPPAAAPSPTAVPTTQTESSKPS